MMPRSELIDIECPCWRRRRGRRRRRICTSSLSIICLFAMAGHAGAFHRTPRDEDDSATHPEKRRLLSSLQNLAERGASRWGDYMSSNQNNVNVNAHQQSLMSKSSPLYISKLHQRIQERQANTEDPHRQSPADFERTMQKIEEITSTTPNHFVQETLACILGGAAASSAFAAATAGAFFGTAVVAFGAIVTVIFEEEATPELSPVGYGVTVGTNEYNAHATHGRVAISYEGCDYNGELQPLEMDEEVAISKKRLASNKLNAFMLEELKKCYDGTPQTTTLLIPQAYSKDMCTCDEGSGHDLSAEERPGQHMQDIPSLEGYSSTDDCSSVPVATDEHPKRVEVAWHDVPGASNIHYFTNTLSTEKRHHKRSKRRRVLKPRLSSAESSMDAQDDPDHWLLLTDAEKDGALLLSKSFGVASSAFGLVGDAVRFTGETTAATAGGVARIAGGAVRVSGWAVGSLGEAIENRGNTDDNVGQRLTPPPNDGISGREKAKKHQVIGSSIKLVGSAIEQVADSLLLAGSATERVAFAAAGAAEGTVRIVEDFASAVSDMFSKEGKRQQSLPPLTTRLDDKSVFIDEELEVNQAIEKDNVKSLQEVKDDTNRSIPDTDTLIDLLNHIASWIDDNTETVIADTVGVPSLAPEMLGVFLICFMASILLLSHPEGKPKAIGSNPSSPNYKPRDMHVTFHHNEGKLSNENEGGNENDSQSTLTAESTMRLGLDWATRQSVSNVTSTVFFLVSLPFKLFRLIMVILFKIIFSSKTALLGIHLFCWFFLSRVSQYKSSVIQRKSETRGYMLAIDSIDTLNVSESAIWLNAILIRVWPGLEQRLSSSASSLLEGHLEHPYSKPSAIAYVALDSFTFGSSPPILSNIEVRDFDDEQSIIYLDVDVGFLLNDAALILDIKPSSLEYRSLPSTKVSINSLDAMASLRVTVQCSTDYPYVSFLNFSLNEVPEFSLRIEPQNESGLKGIDFGSFPVVSKWIKSSIQSSLQAYLEPAYVSVDVLAWLKGFDSVTYVGE